MIRTGKITDDMFCELNHMLDNICYRNDRLIKAYKDSHKGDNLAISTYSSIKIYDEKDAKFCLCNLPNELNEFHKKILVQNNNFSSKIIMHIFNNESITINDNGKIEFGYNSRTNNESKLINCNNNGKVIVNSNSKITLSGFFIDEHTDDFTIFDELVKSNELLDEINEILYLMYGNYDSFSRFLISSNNVCLI